MTAKMRQHSLSVRKLQELVHECNIQLATFRNCVQQIGTSTDTVQLRKELDANVQACVRSCDAAKNCVLPQLKHEGVEFTRYASQFIGCVSACVVEMKRCDALERTYLIIRTDHPATAATSSAATAAIGGGGAASSSGHTDGSISITGEPLNCSAEYIPAVEAMLESLENLITVHYSTSESAPDAKVVPRCRRHATCRPQCICSKLKTSYA